MRKSVVQARTCISAVLVIILAGPYGEVVRAQPAPSTVPATPETAAPVPAFEIPPEQHPDAILPAALVSGPNYHVVDPVHSDGLMNHYVLDGKFGRFEVYGAVALAVRVNEVRALTELEGISGVSIVTGAVVDGVKTQVNTAVNVVKNPVKTVVGIPRGLGNLLRGYRDEAKEAAVSVGSTADSMSTGGHSGGNGQSVTDKGVKAATDYAKDWAGLSDAERHWYEKLHVDPYTDNKTLRDAIASASKLQAAGSYGTRYLGLGIPGIGAVTQVTNAIYHESPATIRARTHERLKAYGLTPEEIEHWERSVTLTPTQQVLLLAADSALSGVAGRDVLFHHVLGLTSNVEISVYLQSVRLLVMAHRQKPFASILSAPWIPAGERADGEVVVCAALDAVYWTDEVARDEPQLRAALPATAVVRRELWLTGTASERARQELQARGWDLHEAQIIENTAAKKP